jgi:hypothetical protein
MTNSSGRGEENVSLLENGILFLIPEEISAELTIFEEIIVKY